MICWLKGEKIDSWQQGLKKGVILACAGVGYEVHLLPSEIDAIDTSEELILWVHQVQREDGTSLYGFKNREERDLFRMLIGVNGVGPQTGLSLLDGTTFQNVVDAIITEDIDTISKAHGIGKRIAERICIELRNKVCDLKTYIDNSEKNYSQDSSKRVANPPEIQDLRSILRSLGYEDIEISKAIRAITSGAMEENEPSNTISPLQGDKPEVLLKQSLLWLSKKAA